MKKVIIASLFFAPALAFAQELTKVENLAKSIGRIINILIPIVAALALLYFFWGLAKFILNSGDEGAKDEGKRIMIWGIVALFVMVAVWGLVGFVGDALNIETDNPGKQDIPGVEIRP